MPLPSLRLYFSDSFFSPQTERFVKYKPDNWPIYRRHAISENSFNGCLLKRFLNWTTQIMDTFQRIVLLSLISFDGRFLISRTIIVLIFLFPQCKLLGLPVIVLANKVAYWLTYLIWKQKREQKNHCLRARRAENMRRKLRRKYAQ